MWPPAIEALETPEGFPAEAAGALHKAQAHLVVGLMNSQRGVTGPLVAHDCPGMVLGGSSQQTCVIPRGSMALLHHS